VKKVNNDLTISEASALLGVTPRSVINYVKSREIEGIPAKK
jgi:hypothetical protein